LARTSGIPEEAIQVALPFLSAWIGASANPNTANSGGIHCLCTYLADEKLLEARPLSSDGGSPWMMRLTMRGWHRFSELQQQGAASSQAFVAMWFNESTQDPWANGLRKGIADAGYDPLRINMKDQLHRSAKPGRVGSATSSTHRGSSRRRSTQTLRRAERA
jgi:hypothetical protein